MTFTSQRSLSLLKGFNFFIYGTSALLTSFLPLYLQDEGFRTTQIGLLMAVGPIMSLVANPFWGYLSDRLQNARLITMMMLIGTLFASQAIFQIHIYFVLFLMMVFFYFFQVALPPISNTLILSSIQNTSYQFGAFRLWGSLGFAVISLISGQLIDWLNIGNLGFIYGALIIVPLALCFGLPEQQSTVQQASLKGMSALLTNRYFIVFLLLSTLVSIPNRMNSIFIGLYIQDLGGSEVYVGLASFWAAIGEIPVFLLLDRYLKKTSKVMVGGLVIVSLLFALRWMLMGVAETPWEIVAIQFLNAVTAGVFLYIGAHLCESLVSEAYQTSGQTWYALFWKGVAGVLGGVLGGWIFSEEGPKGIYSIASMMAILGMIGFFIMWRFLAKGGSPSESRS